MNFSQLHERLRMELLRRIEREVLTASLLALRSGLQQPHISNFLRNKRRLSLPALDRVLAALELTVADLMLAPAQPRPLPDDGIPLVSEQVAIHNDIIRESSIQARLPFALLGDNARPRTTRKNRERFVAVTLSNATATHLDPRLAAGATVILDRHSTPPIDGSINSIYAIRHEGRLHFCYLSLDRGALIASSYANTVPAFLLTVSPNVAPASLIVGRVCCTIQLS
jgi:transcriptional regulator with XRE-family HTH domain